MESAFSTTNKTDFKWPMDKPIIVRPSQPPITTKQKNYFLKGPVEDYCKCDGHTYNTFFKRYEKLAEKEKLLHDELAQVNLQMSTLSNEMIDNACDTDEVLQSTYQIDYVKRGLNIPQYTKLMPAVDSPVGVPVKSMSIGLGEGYIDPTSFRYSAFTRPIIDPCPPVTFTTTPETLNMFLYAEDRSVGIRRYNKQNGPFDYKKSSAISRAIAFFKTKIWRYVLIKINFL